jgi:OOP family OmpA-OmpF porin
VKRIFCCTRLWCLVFSVALVFVGCNKETMKGTASDMDTTKAKTINEAISNNVSAEDSDGDGVPDNRDKSPGTPAGVAVDGFGRPWDSDYDGIPDFMDKDLMTPLGVKVDIEGKPLDSDKDGIPDYRDRHPSSR